MAKKTAKGNIFGIGGGEYEKIDSFPRVIKKGEMLIHEIKCDKSLKYLNFYKDDNGKDVFTINEVSL